MLHAIEEPATRFQKATRHIDISARKVIQAAPNTPKEDNRRSDSKLDQFANVPGRFEPRVKILILLVLRLTMELLLELGDDGSCDFRPYSISNRCNPRVVGNKVEAIPWHQEQRLRQALSCVLVRAVVRAELLHEFVHLFAPVAIRKLFF